MSKQEKPSSWDLVISDFENGNLKTDSTKSPEDFIYSKLIEIIFTINCLENPECVEDLDLLCKTTLELFKERDKFGWQKYNKPLTPFDGRNFLKETKEEILDAIVYMRNVLYEKEKAL